MMAERVAGLMAGPTTKFSAEGTEGTEGDEVGAAGEEPRLQTLRSSIERATRRQAESSRSMSDRKVEGKGTAAHGAVASSNETKWTTRSGHSEIGQR